MGTEWNETRSNARPVCPNCKRYRGVRWRIKAQTFTCTLCGHTWSKEGRQVGYEGGVYDRYDEEGKPMKKEDDGSAKGGDSGGSISAEWTTDTDTDTNAGHK
jgi:ribosomal protein L37AE/L43A